MARKFKYLKLFRKYKDASHVKFMLDFMYTRRNGTINGRCRRGIVAFIGF